MSVPACKPTIVIRAISFFLFPGFHVLDLAIMTVFELANAQPGGPFYTLSIVSAEGGVVTGAGGAGIQAQRWQDAGLPGDTLFVLGCASPARRDDEILAMLGRFGAAARRIGLVSEAAQAFAAAGLLDGRRVTVHTEHAQAMHQRHPRIAVAGDEAYVRDGRTWSCAGMAASIDMALAMVEEDLGLDTALAVARRLVLYQWRREGQAQSSSLLHLRSRSSPIQAVLSYASGNLRKQLSLDELAGHANMSRRHFTRVFRAETGRSPARAIEALRAEAAHALLRTSRMSLEAIAREAGFTSVDRMRQALERVYGATPQDIRRGLRAA